MTVQITLSPEEFDALDRRAQAHGVDIETVLHRLIAGSIRPTAPEAKRGMSARFASERGERGTEDPEERAEREREAAEMRNNIDRWRAEQRQGL